ncbi:MAG: proton-conducting transporter membrane subunit [Candidatus Saccharicenans sp.]|nr:proton-conducting transporter membrane subunit [Candidatus Saccharicenans sp.]
MLIDGLSSLFLMLLAVLTLSSTVFSAGFNQEVRPVSNWKFYLVFPWFIAGLVGLLTVDDLGPGFTVAWQIMAWSSYLLVRWGRPAKLSSRPALVYLLFMQAAWLMVVGAPFLVKGYKFGEPLMEIGQKLAESRQLPSLLFFALLLLGFGLKTGVFPLGQLWIPKTYSTANPSVSALLAGILEKTGVFGLVRVFFFLSNGTSANFSPAGWGKVLLIAGTLTLFIGTVQAIKQSEYLKLLAYSSIGQVGYIIFALGGSLLAASSGTAAGQSLALVIFVGAVYHSLNHGIFKSLLFLTGGNLLYSTGTRDLNRLGGLLAVMPATGLLVALASYSIAGMPGSSGFVSKWLMISGNFLAGRDNLLMVVSGIIALFTAAFTLACYVKFFGLAFTSAGANWKLNRKVREVPAPMLGAGIFLALVCLSQAFLPMAYVRLIGLSMSRSQGFMLADAGQSYLSGSLFNLKIFAGQQLLAAVSPLIILVLIVALIILARAFRQSAGTVEVPVPTWLCGYQDLNRDNVYADRNMFSDLRKFFWWTGGNSHRVVDDEAVETGQVKTEVGS